MSDTRQTEALLEQLARDAAPLRPVPRIRVALAILGGLSAIVAALYLRFWVGVRADFASLLGGDPRFASIWLGLAVLAAGAALWVVAASVPGRTALERFGRRSACFGALLGFVVGPAAVLLHSGGAALHADVHEFVCMGGAFRIAVLPGVALVAWVLWAAPANPGRTALCAALGAGALGALVVHASCPDTNPGHWMVGHAFAPLAAAAAAALPILGLARWQRARRRGLL